MTGADGRARDDRRRRDVRGRGGGHDRGADRGERESGDDEGERDGATGTTRGFEKDGDVVKAKRSFERELVPFDFEDGTSAVDAVVREANVESRRSRGRGR